MGFIHRQVRKTIKAFRSPISGSFSSKQCAAKVNTEEDILQYMVQLSSRDLYKLVRQALHMRIEVRRQSSRASSRADQPSNCTSDSSIEDRLSESFKLPVDCIEEIERNHKHQNEHNINQEFPALKVRIPVQDKKMTIKVKENEHQIPSQDHIRQSEQDIDTELEQGLGGKVFYQTFSTSSQSNGKPCPNSSTHLNGSPRLNDSPRGNDSPHMKGSSHLNDSHGLNGSPRVNSSSQLHDSSRLKGSPCLNWISCPNDSLLNSRSLGGSPINGNLLPHDTSSLNCSSRLSSASSLNCSPRFDESTWLTLPSHHLPASPQKRTRGFSHLSVASYRKKSASHQSLACNWTSSRSIRHASLKINRSKLSSNQSLACNRSRLFSHQSLSCTPTRLISHLSVASSSPIARTTRCSRKMSTQSRVTKETRRPRYISKKINIDTALNLLESVFPSETLAQLKWEMGDSIAKHHPSASVFFSDIVGFTDWCATKLPSMVIECLSAYFQILDDLAEIFGVYKVETIGDAWMGVCGAPNSEVYPADIMGSFAIQVLETLQDLKEIFQSSSISLRIGLHCGPVVGGVVRADRPRWQLFGDTVNMASRMESTGVPGHIQISRDMYDALKSSPRTTFTCTSRGLTEIKGKGFQETFFLKAMETNITNSSNIAMGLTDLERLTIFNPSTSTEPERRNKSFSDVHDLLRHTTSTLEDSNSFDSDLICRPNPQRRISVEDIKTTKHLGQKAILIVDDMPSILMQFRRVLKRTGLTVYTALHGHEALELLKEREYVIAFMDLNMPWMSGVQCMQQFREWESSQRPTRAQPIIAMSSDSSFDEQELCALGFSGFHPKNGDKNDILNRVSRFHLLPIEVSALDRRIDRDASL